MNHAIVRESVPISGAGISRFGPTVSRSSCANRRVNRSCSVSENRFGSTTRPPFSPSEGDIHARTLSRHPHRQTDTLLLGDARMIPDSTLVGTTNAVVLRTIAGKHLDGPIVPFQGDGDAMDVRWMAQPLDDVRIDVQPVRHSIQLPTSGFERRFSVPSFDSSSAGRRREFTVLDAIGDSFEWCPSVAKVSVTVITSPGMMRRGYDSATSRTFVLRFRRRVVVYISHQEFLQSTTHGQ